MRPDIGSQLHACERFRCQAGAADFIHACCCAEDCGGDALKSYRTTLVDQFFSKRGIGKLKLTEALEAIDHLMATGTSTMPS